MGADLVSQILMIYSSSPLARQLCAQLETGDPFNIDVKLDMDSKNRNAEILNVYLKTKGLKITFKKHLKKPIKPATIAPMTFFDKPEKHPMIFYDHGEKIDVEKIVEELKETRDHPKKHPMEFFPMEFFDDELHHIPLQQKANELLKQLDEEDLLAVISILNRLAAKHK